MSILYSIVDYYQVLMIIILLYTFLCTVMAVIRHKICRRATYLAYQHASPASDLGFLLLPTSSNDGVHDTGTSGSGQ